MQAIDPAPYSISVVVIGLNEALHLARCFTSIRECLRQGADHLAGWEVLYVDSGSNDGSVQIAREEADAVYRLEEAPTAGAARAVGLERADGELILFLDGDMEIHPSWLRTVLQRWPAAGTETKVAGLVGVRDDIEYQVRAGEIEIQRTWENVYRITEPGVAFHFGGALLARSRTLRQIGGYRPELRSFEEPDLHARLRADGWRVGEIPVPFIRHYLPQQVPAWKRAWRSFLPDGPSRDFGRMLRCAISEGYVRGFVVVSRASVAVWIADGLSLVAFVAGLHLWSVVGLQLAAVALALAWRRPEDFILGRGRLIGVVAALVEGDDSRALYRVGQHEAPPHTPVDS